MLREAKAVAKAKEARVHWAEGMQFVGESGSGHAIVLDASPPEGRNTAASPMELLLIAVAGCTAIDIVSILEKKRQKIRGLEVFAHGDQRDEPPNIYTDIVLEYVVRGEGVSEKAVQQAIALSAEKYCSAAAMVNKVANVVTRYRIEEG